MKRAGRIIAAALATILVAVVVLLIAPRNKLKAPSFLSGVKPSRVSQAGKEAQSSMYLLDDAVGRLRRFEGQLTTEGWSRMPDMYGKGNLVYRRSSGGMINEVLFFPDKKLVNFDSKGMGGSYGWKPEKGWVSVVLLTYEDPNVVSRVAGTLGF